MNVGCYFNTTVEYEEYLGNKNKFMMDAYEEALPIKCRIEGKVRYIRNESNELTVSEQSYWTLHNVKVKDKIQGQYVIAVMPIYDFDGSLVYYEAFV